MENENNEYKRNDTKRKLYNRQQRDMEQHKCISHRLSAKKEKTPALLLWWSILNESSPKDVTLLSKGHIQANPLNVICTVYLRSPKSQGFRFVTTEFKVEYSIAGQRVRNFQLYCVQVEY